MNSSTRPLIIFTHHYPFGEMELFLETEILYLKEVFPHIVVVPNQTIGPMRAVPKGITVDTSFAKTYRGKDPLSLMRKAARSFFHPPFYKELLQAPKTSAHLRKLLGYSSEASRCASWVKRLLLRRPELQQAIFYTYWLYDHASGIAGLKKKFQGIKAISRAHGFDLYEEDYPPAYIPFRPSSLQEMDKICLISDNGRCYLAQKYPSIAKLLTVSRLGVEDPGFVVRANADGIFRLVSCSHLIPLKRLELQIDGIAAFAKKHPELSLEWHLIGDGPLREHLLEHARIQFPFGMKWSFHGHLPNKEIFSLYKSLQPDVFLLTSSTEGLPVSIMEAYACGIPAIATDVGGVSEIVDHDTGILLPSSASAEEILQALEAMLLSPQKLVSSKAAARRHWAARFDAKANYRRFADDLLSLSLGRPGKDEPA